MGEVVAAWTFFMLRSWIKQTALNEELRAKLQSEHCFAAPSMRSANRLQAFARHLCSGGEQEVTESESTECRFFFKTANRTSTTNAMWANQRAQRQSALVKR